MTNSAESPFTDLVVISGFSGAGKSVGLGVFEDAGYFCVDNLPPEMIGQLAQLFRHDGANVRRACVVSDTRGGEHLEHLSQVIDGLRGEGVPVRLLMLEADEQTLINRYKETRRRHPLSPGGSVADGIRRERKLLDGLGHQADLTIDTSGLTPATLRRQIVKEMLDRERAAKLAVTLVSFGHKYGSPRDIDLAFDVRFLRNPHYDPDLRPLTGFDERVVAHIAEDGRLEQFYERVVPLIDFLLPQYVTEGKSHLVIAIGCTGGRHRSVAITEHLAAHCRRSGGYLVEVQHRDINRIAR